MHGDTEDAVSTWPRVTKGVEWYGSNAEVETIKKKLQGTSQINIANNIFFF